MSQLPSVLTSTGPATPVECDRKMIVCYIIISYNYNIKILCKSIKIIIYYHCNTFGNR